jgi:hypothetical protein
MLRKNMFIQGGGLTRPTPLYYHFLRDSKEAEVFKPSLVPVLHMLSFVIILVSIQVKINIAI